MDAAGIFEQLFRGLSTVGNALKSAVQFVLSFFGIVLPDYAILLATIILLILVIYKLGSAINKVVLIALIFILMCSLAGLTSPLLGQLGLLATNIFPLEKGR